MKNKIQQLEKFQAEARATYLPSVAINTVIFGFDGLSLNVLLMGFAESPLYSLPGGYVMKEEDLEAASRRVLTERTGLENVYLEQFFTAGNVDRLSEAVVEKEFKKLGWKPESPSWFSERKVSVCYYALVDPQKTVPQKLDFFVRDFIWRPVSNLPALMYDHSLIIEKAVQRLQWDMDRKVISSNLMNETFTMNELQTLYEAVYQKQFTRTNFHRKMLQSDFLERLEKKYEGKSHKAPYLYRFKK
ncbi:NUDIX hydrolase [Cyclobacterium xiamenense]|uniref:NUDIX hydrolase n=1 Tax=Cyclobacterium xiamenense TaxID=1297121 RepID=UPI0035CFF16F